MRKVELRIEWVRNIELSYLLLRFFEKSIKVNFKKLEIIKLLLVLFIKNDLSR